VTSASGWCCSPQSEQQEGEVTHILRIPVNIEVIKGVGIRVRVWVIVAMWKRQHWKELGQPVNQQRLVSGAHGQFVDLIKLIAQVTWLVIGFALASYGTLLQFDLNNIWQM